MGTDERLRAAMHGAAREPSVDGVVDAVHDRIAAKRARRVAVRRAELVSIATVVIIGVFVAGVAITGGGGDDRRVAIAPGPGTTPLVGVSGPPGVGGPVTPAATSHVRLAPDEGYVRGPLLAVEGVVTAAAYDRAGDSFTVPPSRVVRVSPAGDVVDRIDLKGEILSYAEGEGARWALTRDKVVTGPLDPEFRLKRIGPDGTVTSNPLPPGVQPAGAIAAGGGGVWVPVRTGVLRCDPATGAFAASIDLSTATDRRGVAASGKAVYVTDGAQLSRLDPATDRAIPSGAAAVPEVEALTDVADGFPAWALGRSASGNQWTVLLDDRTLRLPESFAASGIFTAGDVAWVEGTDGDRHTLLMLSADGDRPTIARTVHLANTDDATVTFVSGDTMVITSRGSMFRVQLPR